ncbi:MAG: hypothetical protein ABI629_10035 [bacterium]
MHRSIALLMTAFALVTVAGCSAKSGESAKPAATALAIPADSPLAKISVGMTAQEVSNILGMPTNQVSYATGKAWIPWYFGDDARRTEWSYKGLGRVVFTGGNVFGGGGGHVNRVDYDPSETGIRNPS